MNSQRREKPRAVPLAQEVFRDALQIADVPAILPQDRAAVSKTRS
jgi:hypothetical protein